MSDWRITAADIAQVKAEVERETRATLLGELSDVIEKPPLPSDRTFYEEGWIDLRQRVRDFIVEHMR